MATGRQVNLVGDRQYAYQKSTDVVCIYCAIGQRGDAVTRVVQALTEGGMLKRSIVVNAGDEEAPGLAYIAPYAAMSMAEYFSAQGRDVLVVIDDMTHHARAYRELSLLLHRPPGREAFPGDIFYVHARLLERAASLGKILEEVNYRFAGMETEAENLAAYIRPFNFHY